MPTFWAVALTFSLFSVYIGSGNFQKTTVRDQGKDLVAAASTTNNETKKEDKLTKILPLVTFDCTGRIEGYYADIQFDCEAFHYCKSSGERFTFVCPPKSRFNQKHMICDYDRYGMKLCYTAEKYFKLNENLYPKTEDQKDATNVSTSTVKPQERIKLPIIKNKAIGKEEIKHVKPETNKAKLEKTYIVTEYYDHDPSTTEQPLTDDASPKVYKWYTPPVTSDTPLDDVEYDDSIRHQYEYPEDYPEDQSYYDHPDGQSQSDHRGGQTLKSHAHENSKKNDNYKQHEQRKLNKKDEANIQSPSEDKSHYKNKQNNKEHIAKQPELRDSNYDASQNDKLYENSNSKGASHSKLRSQMIIREKAPPESQIAKETYHEVSRPQKESHLKEDRHNEHGYSEPTEKETQEHEKGERIETVYHLNPTSDEQSGESNNYHQQPHMTHEQESELKYHQKNNEDQNENYAVNKAEHGKVQPEEFEDVRNQEREFESSSGKRIIDLPQSKYSETVNTRNSHNGDEPRYMTPNPKVNQHKIILNNPEGNTKVYTQHRIPDERKPKNPLPQSKSKTMSFYHRFTSKMEQPTKTTVYRGELLPDDQINITPYSERASELKDLQNYQQEDNPQKENSKEIHKEQRGRQISHPEMYHQEETSQEEIEDDGQEDSHEERTEEVDNQHIPPRQHYREQEQPQRNVRIYIQQEPHQQKQIPIEIYPQLPYQHDRSEDIQSYQQNIPQKEHSEEAMIHEQLTQHRPESSTENIYNQDKVVRYTTMHRKKLPERGYYTHNNRDADRNEGSQIRIINTRPHSTKNNQYSNQHYLAKQSKNKRPVNTYQLNQNVRESHPTIPQELIVQQQNRQPEYHHNIQHNVQEKYIPDSRIVYNQKKHLNVNVYKPHSGQPNDQQQQRQTNYRHRIIPEQLQQTHQPHHETVHNYDTRNLQQFSPHNTPYIHHHQASEQPRIRFITRRQKRQTSNGLPLSSQFRALLNRLYTPRGSASNSHLNNFQNFISSSIPSSQASETSRNPTQHRPTNYFPQQYHYNPRYSNPYNSDVQTLYDRSPVYSDPPFEQTPYYYQPPDRPPLSSHPNHFRYFDDNGEQLDQNIRNSPQRPAEEVPSPPNPTTNNQQDDTSSRPAISVEQTKEPQQSSNSRKKPLSYPPLSSINPQNYPELKDFPFFNPSYPYSQEANSSSKDSENSQFSYNRIPPPRYHVPDLGVYFDPYGEFSVTPLYEPSQTSSDDTKDPDSTESPASKEHPEENKGKNEDSSRRRVPGKIKRPLNVLSNPPYKEKNQHDKSREEISLFVTAPPQHPVSTYNPQSVHLLVTPPPFLTGHSRVPSVFGPEFFVPPLRPPFTTESTPIETIDDHVKQHDSSLEISSEVTTQTPYVQVTTQRQRTHRRRPQSTIRPIQSTRGTTRRPSATRSPSRQPSTSERGSSRHLSESIIPPPEHSQHSRSTTRRPTSTRQPTRPVVRERPKPATLLPIRPTQQSTSQSDSSDDEEPNPFHGSVPYGTRLRRPPPSRQTSSLLSHERSPAIITKRVQESSASDQSITVAKKEPRQRTRHIKSVERSYQPRRATNQFRESTPAPISSTTHQSSPQTEVPSRNIFRYSNEEATTVSYHPNEDEEEQRVRRPSVRRATYIRKNQNLKPEAKPKLFRGRTRIHHPRRGYTEASTQSTTITTSEAATTPITTTSTTKAPSAIITAAEATTQQTIIIETEPTPKLRVYTSRHGGSLRNERVINRLKDKPRLFTFGRPRGVAADDSSFDDTNFATESSSESKLSILT